MGYNTESIRVGLRLSSHNSEQDVADLQARDELLAAIENLVASEERFERIVTDVGGAP